MPNHPFWITFGNHHHIKSGQEIGPNSVVRIEAANATEATTIAEKLFGVRYHSIEPAPPVNTADGKALQEITLTGNEEDIKSSESVTEVKTESKTEVKTEVKTENTDDILSAFGEKK